MCPLHMGIMLASPEPPAGGLDKKETQEMRKRYKKLWHHYSTPEEVRQQGIETQRYYERCRRLKPFFDEERWRKAGARVERLEAELARKYWPR